MITQSFDINLIPDSAPVVLHCDQYDHGTGRYIATLYDGSLSYTPGAGATAIVQGMKPDRHGFIYAATISTNKVTFDLTEQMSACDGMVACQIVVTETDGRTGSFVFFLAVQRSALPADSDLSQSDYQLVEDLLEEAQAISITISIGTTTTLPAGSSATVTNSGTATDPIFNFGIPKGDTGAAGQDGTDGTSAGFGTPTASVDANTGTPSVTITASGPDTAKVFDFAFHNLKGDPGVGSVTYDSVNKAIIFTPV